MAAISCPICGGTALAPLGVRDGYSLACCRTCRHSFVEEMPDAAALEEHYRTYSYERETLATVPEFIREITRGKIARLSKYRRTNRFLDVGFGVGVYLQQARALGWDVYGIEFSSTAVEKARENGLGEIVHGDLASAPWEPGSFDVIVMSEVLEHLVDVRDPLLQAARLLGPGSAFFATTPHGRGLNARVFGASWAPWAPPEHLQMFSVTSMSLALRAAGMTPRRIRCRGFRPHELLDAARKTLRGAPAGEPPANRVAEAIELNRAMSSRRSTRAVKYLANGVLGALRAGDSLEVLATREG